MVSQGSNGEEGKKGKKRKRDKEGGTLRVPGDLLFLTSEEGGAYLRETLGDSNGDDKDDEGGEPPTTQEG